MLLRSQVGYSVVAGQTKPLENRVGANVWLFFGLLLLKTRIILGMSLSLPPALSHALDLYLFSRSFSFTLSNPLSRLLSGPLSHPLFHPLSHSPPLSLI